MKKLKTRKIKQIKKMADSFNKGNEPYDTGSLKKPGQIPGPKSTGRLSASKSDLLKESYTKEELERIKISSDLKENTALLEHMLGANTDFKHRFIESKDKKSFAIFYLEGMVRELLLNRDIIKPLQGLSKSKEDKISLEYINKHVLSSGNATEINNMHQAVDSVLYGGVLVFREGEGSALSIYIQDWQQRSPEEPVNESGLRGSREGFVETLRVNTSLIRRRLRSPNLVIEEFTLGEATHTGIAVAYYKGVVSPDLVQEVKSRLKRIKTDAISESNYILEFIEDKVTLFPLIIETERPDKVVTNLLEGRVAVLVDNSPFVLLMPAMFTDFFQTPDDYYNKSPIMLFLRPLRYIAFLTSLILPSFYVALTTFHQEMIPLDLLTKIAASREGVPFPAGLEALTMQLIFELIREAGVRLPRVIGSAVSIVGALIIGTASVDAGLVSPLMVIIVALTGISSFVVPIFSFSIVARLLVFPLIILAATFGLFGVSAGLMVILIHMLGLRSFGVPYLSPISPFHSKDFSDLFTNAPHWEMHERPAELVKVNEQRMKPNLKPSPEKG